ncbi:MAG: hypothetical protein CMG71_06050 [Candidatus Marinimicrobia bacterium]|nr:hypothetical protein [Candidatus Neomarinimicrobiota bacterium]|tara:strand:+ start:3076 stop:3972 length:897 start_codon:yes stop_codon:yes gene_type:complete
MIPLRERKQPNRTNRLSLSLLFPVLLCAQPQLLEFTQFSKSLNILESDFTATRISVSSFEDIYLLDSDRSLLVRMSANGQHIRTVGGWGETGELFSTGTDLSASHGLDILLLDSDTHRIIRFDRQLNFLDEINLFQSEDRFEFPVAIARNRLGEVAVASSTDDRVTLMNLAGRSLSVMGDEKYGEDRFSDVMAISVNERNEIGVIDEKVRLVVLNRSGRLLWQRDLDTEVIFVESVGALWFIGNSGGHFALVDQNSYTTVELGQTLSDPVIDVAIKGKKIFILSEPGDVFTASLFQDE